MEREIERWVDGECGEREGWRGSVEREMGGGGVRRERGVWRERERGWRGSVEREGWKESVEREGWRERVGCPLIAGVREEEKVRLMGRGCK